MYGRELGAPDFIAPDIVAFTADVCGATRDTMIVIRNTGGAPLEISSATFVANDEGFSLLPPVPTSTSPLIIAPGDSGTIAFRFAPSAPGTKSGTLELVSNAEGSPHRIGVTGRRDRVEVNAEQIVAFPS